MYLQNEQDAEEILAAVAELKSTESYMEHSTNDTVIGVSRVSNYILTYKDIHSFDDLYKQSAATIRDDLLNWYLTLFFCYVSLYVVFLIILQCYTARRILTPIRDLTELIKNPAGLKNEKSSRKPII